MKPESRGTFASAIALVVLWAATASAADKPPEPGSIKLPYELPAKHMGVSTCSSTVCHGSTKSNSSYNVQLNEYITWSHQDVHAKAYTVLLNERSRAIAAKMGIGDASKAKICLDCHADNVPEAQRGREFNIADGIGCETCHGGAERWLETHAKPEATYQQNLERGMFATANVATRATLCSSCHVGNADKYATHRIMGAGHPRLSFELDTFQALQPPHHQVDKDYAERKPTYSRTAVWAYGQLESARLQAQLIQQHFVRDGRVFPELALFNCHSCHESSMRRLDWTRGLTTTGNPPGSVPLNDGHLRMAILVARQLDATAARDLLSIGQMLQEASGESRERVAQASGRLELTLRQLAPRVAEHKWTRAQEGSLLAAILDLGVRREYRDYISAEQATMATELIMIDLGTAERYRPKLDALYRMVEDDETFRPQPFAGAMEQLRSALGLGSSTAPSASTSKRPLSPIPPGVGWAHQSSAGDAAR
jgi:predicted CxxxxCH...CXXCH cytochrome family protein